MRRLVLVLSWVVTACGGGAVESRSAESPYSAVASYSRDTDDEEEEDGSGEKVAEARSAPSKLSRTADKAELGAIPTKCANGTCMPERRFVQKLCSGKYPSVALYLFAQNKMKRGYLPFRTKAIYASGGLSGDWIDYEEEVLVLLERKPDPSQMQMSNVDGSWDVLRWNGNCVTLMLGELNFRRPGTPRAAKVEFRFLDDNLQDVLRKDRRIDEAYRDRRGECQGAHSGKVSLDCVKADQRLNELVVDYIRRGGRVPVPKNIPE